MLYEVFMPRASNAGFIYAAHLKSLTKYIRSQLSLVTGKASSSQAPNLRKSDSFHLPQPA